MRSIIASVDFTDASDNAARYAADLAVAVGAELHLVHVLDLPSMPREVPMPDSVLDDIRDRGLTSLKNLADELTVRTHHAISIATDQETGPIERWVKDFCKWKNPFLVVRGAPVGEMPSIRQLPFPLLTVPSYATFHPINTIVLAFDTEDINGGMAVPVDFLQQLRELLKARFEVLHVAPRHEETATVSFREWRATLDKSISEIHFMKGPTVEDGIRAYLDHHETDWLVVFPKKSGVFHLHKSLSSHVVLHCPVPVMSIKQ